MDRLQKYRELNNIRLSLSSNWEKFRFVCIDSESTGFDPRRDSLVSLGGVGLCEGEICLFDEFSIVVPVAYNTSAVTVHGITREAAAQGIEESEALLQFLEWLADGVIVGHHIQHDLKLINNACLRHFGFVLRNVSVDTMGTYLQLKHHGGFADNIEHDHFSLDALCEQFNIVPHDRHTALGDAFLTAQILLRILKEAGKLGMWNLSDLHAWYADEDFPFACGNLP